MIAETNSFQGRSFRSTLYICPSSDAQLLAKILRRKLEHDALRAIPVSPARSAGLIPDFQEWDLSIGCRAPVAEVKRAFIARLAIVYDGAVEYLTFDGRKAQQE